MNVHSGYVYFGDGGLLSNISGGGGGATGVTGATGATGLFLAQLHSVKCMNMGVQL